MLKSAKVFAIIMVLGLVFAGIGFAQMAEESESQQATESQQAVQSQQAPVSQQAVELTGTILSDNTFVDENGDSYQLTANDKSEELKEMAGKKIKVKATVMENEEGQKSLAITSYEVIQEEE